MSTVHRSDPSDKPDVQEKIDEGVENALEMDFLSLEEAKEAFRQ